MAKEILALGYSADYLNRIIKADDEQINGSDDSYRLGVFYIAWHQFFIFKVLMTIHPKPITKPMLNSTSSHRYLRLFFFILRLAQAVL